VRAVLVALVGAASLAAALAAPAGATNECRGIQQCIPVPGPWVVVPAHGTAEYLLTCPQGVVGGLDAQATSRSVHVWWDAQLGAPVQPGTSTARSALFHAVSTAGSPQAFQPRLGCIPARGGGGRSTVSARVTPAGPSLAYHAQIVVIGPSEVKFGRVGCQGLESLVGGWHAVAFRTKTPPNLQHVVLVHARHVIAGRKVVVTASSTDALSVDAHAVVQVGAVCAP
jgi:hypothetical protein